MQRASCSMRQYCMLRLSYKRGQPQVASASTAASASASCLFRRHFSNSSDDPRNDDAALAAAGGPLPLFLVLNAQTNKDNVNMLTRPKLLLPPEVTVTPSMGRCVASAVTVTSIQDIVDAVNQHYSAENENKQQFVGGMGESDPGVWFVVPSSAADNNNTTHNDPLDHAALVAESIMAVKEQRHGVPFGLYTTGILASNEDDDDMVMSCLQRLKTLQVSLYAASPPDYSKATGFPMPEAQVAFGRACSFLAMAGEQKYKFTLEVGLSKSLSSSSAKAGRDLAMSLGAQQVHFY